MKYKVEIKNGSHYIIGLKEEFFKGSEPDSILIYHYSYPESETPDVDTNMKNAEMMHGALYDFLQCCDTIHEDDIFETEFGNFVCKGIDIIPYETPTKI